MRIQYWWVMIIVLLLFIMVGSASMKKETPLAKQLIFNISYDEFTSKTYSILRSSTISNNTFNHSLSAFFVKSDPQLNDYFQIQLQKNKVQIADYVKNNINIQVLAPHEEKENELTPNGKYIALTFDDGPNPTVTPRVLDILKEYQIKASFFMLGMQVKGYPSIAKRVEAEGHDIGNHSYSHSRLIKLTDDKIREELEDTNHIIMEAIGCIPTIFRPPYGAYNDTIINIASEQKEQIILWSVDSEDWKNRDAETVKTMVLDTILPGAVVLLHDIYPTTADALPGIITALKGEGYQFVTVSELLTLNETSKMGPFYGFIDRKK